MSIDPLRFLAPRSSSLAFLSSARRGAAGVSPGQAARLGAIALLAGVVVAAAASRGAAPETARPAVLAAR
ncbi:hypothetical protein [Methylocella sp.]|uniref:hypothetical protein n=1 Tax=Methylocella sp. TaxID=1978226 RepID=UPI0035AEB84B